MPRCCCRNGILPEATGRPTSDDETAAYRAAWRACLANLPAMPDTLLLRDYHQDNLLWLPARPGVKACGLLDFQDALSRATPPTILSR